MASDRRRPGPRRSGVAWAVLAASLVLTALVAYLAGAAADARDQVRFRNAALGAEARIVGRLEVYVAILRGGAGLFATDPSVRPAEFRDYAARLDLPRNYPGTQGFGFARRLRAEQVDSVQAALRGQGHPGFRLRPAEPRREVFPILFLEPLDRRNQAALGYDMFTEPVRRAAMERARDGGAPAMTARVRLVQEIEGVVQPGFLIYVPVYTPGPIPATVEERRRRLVGFVYSPFRAGDLFRGLFEDQRNPDVAFRVYDGPRAHESRLLYASHPGRKAAYSRTGHLTFGGQQWTVQFASTTAFESGLRRRLGWALAAMGVAASLVLWWLTRAQVRARDEAEELALRLREQALALEQQVAQSMALNRELEASNRKLERARGEALDAARRAERLQGVAEQLAEAATPEQVAEAVARVGMRSAGAVAVVLFHQVEGYLEMVRGEGLPEAVEAEWRTLALAGGGPLAETALGGEPVWLETAEAMQAAAPLSAPPLGWQALAALPLLVEGDVRGVLALGYRAPRGFSPGERTYWRTLARITAQAMERARLFAAERSARAEAEEANRAKSEFLSAMSHELRTPLNAIGGYAELLEMGIRGEITADQRADLQRIRRAQRHLLGLINDVLNFTRLEAGGLELHPTAVPLSGALADLRAMMEPQVRARGLRAEYPEDVDALAARADPERLQQILLNLVGNAVKFTPPGGEIRVTCAGRGERVEVRVADTGRGIPPDRLESIFDPFVQVDRRSTDLSEQGVGLGLAISRDLARAMGGDITVESEVGRGSVFTVSLPRTTVPEHSPPHRD